VTLPAARVVHRSATRVRIRVPSQRGNGAFFDELKEAYADLPGIQRVEAAPATGSVLFVGSCAAPGEFERLAPRTQMFRIEGCGRKPRSLPGRTVRPMADLNRGIRRMTDGRIDLSGALFFTLLGSACYQIARGNFGAPPWYTAFWYAFGVYTKQLIDDKHDPDPLG